MTNTQDQQLVATYLAQGKPVTLCPTLHALGSRLRYRRPMPRTVRL